MGIPGLEFLLSKLGEVAYNGLMERLAKIKINPKKMLNKIDARMALIENFMDYIIDEDGEIDKVYEMSEKNIRKEILRVLDGEIRDMGRAEAFQNYTKDFISILKWKYKNRDWEDYKRAYWDLFISSKKFGFTNPNSEIILKRFSILASVALKMK